MHICVIDAYMRIMCAYVCHICIYEKKMNDSNSYEG